MECMVAERTLHMGEFMTADDVTFRVLLVVGNLVGIISAFVAIKATIDKKFDRREDRDEAFRREMSDEIGRLYDRIEQQRREFEAAHKETSSGMQRLAAQIASDYVTDKVCALKMKGFGK